MALVLFAFGAMAVVSSTAVLTRAATGATRGIELSRIAKSRTELLASLSCSSRQSGAETVQNYEEEWTVLPGAPGTVVARVRVFSPADSSAVEHEVVLPC